MTISILALITTFLVLIGAGFMTAAITDGRKIKGRVPSELQGKWRIMIRLMLFFLAGYIFLVFILVKRIPFPIELVTGSVFLGGAFFVFIVINLTRDTIGRIMSAENELRLLNESLERRVTDRTQELQRSHEFLRTVLDSLNDSVIIISVKDFKIAGANLPFLQEYGLTPEEAMGRTCYEITHNRTTICAPPRDVCPLLETAVTGKFATAEHIHYDKNGNLIHAEIGVSPIRDRDGRISKVVHVSRDITERKKAEQALRESEEQLRNILDSIHAGIMIINPRNHQIVDVNTYAADMIGARKELIIGQVCHQFVCPAAQGHCPITDACENVDNAERLLVKTDGSRLPILKSVIAVQYHGEEHLMESFISISHLKNVEGELQRLVSAVKESEERYRRLVELSPDGIALQVDNKFVFMNPAGMNLLAVDRPDFVIGKPVLDIVHPDTRDASLQRMQSKQSESVVWQEEKYVRFDGKAVDVEVAGVPFYYNGQPAVQTIFRDITERKLTEQRLKQLALYDTLTGLPNRTLFFDRVRQLLALARRNKYILALLYIDLDRFKVINDTLGHELGDLLLKEAAERMLSCTRSSDTVARVGGDEFIGICGKIEATDDAEIVARKIRDVLAKPFRIKGHECGIGASIGISLYPADGEDIETLLNKADAAMYRVKEGKKGGYLLYRDMKEIGPL